MRELAAAHQDIAATIGKLERAHDGTESVIAVLVEDIDKIGFDL